MSVEMIMSLIAIVMSCIGSGISIIALLIWLHIIKED